MAQITLNSTGVASNGALVLQSNGTTTAVTVDTAQNVGICVTPSAWGSEWAAMQYGLSGSVASYKSGTTAEFMQVISNAYNDNTSWRYIQSGAATRYEMRDSEHRWLTSPSGTAGNTFSFTQAMTLNPSGQLTVGNTSSAFDSTTYAVVGSGTGDSGLAIYTSNATAGYLQFADGTSGAEEYRGFIKYDHSTNAMSFSTNSSARTDAEVTIDSAGNLQVQAGAVMPYAPAHDTSIGSAATLTNAIIQKQIIVTSGTTYTVTMPLGTTLETLATWATTGIAYDFYVINTASGTITLDATEVGVTSVGTMTIATGVSAQFRIRRTAANTFVVYRLG